MTATARRYVTLASVFTLLAAAAVAAETPAAPQSTAPAPHLVATEMRADVGVLVKGNKGHHTFVLRNEGNAPAKITGVEPSCHCTIASFDATIPPGGEGKVSADVDSLLVNGKGATALRVHSNDPASPLELSLAYEVVIKLQAKPGYARWATTQGETEGTIGNTIWSNDGKDFKVTAVDSPRPYIRTAFRPAKDDEKNPKATGSQWRIELTLDAQAPVGSISGEVVVHTDHPDQKLMPLPVSGFMRPVVFVYPDKGEMGTLESAKLPLRASFKFKNFATEPITVTAVESTIPGSTTAIDMVEYGREYQVRLVLPAGMAAGEFSGKLAIRTDSPKMPLVEVPLHGVIQTAAATPSK